MNLKKKSVFTILTLAFPSIVENIMYVLLGVVDTYFVGKLGTQAIAGVGITNLTMNISIAFFLALGIGTTAFISRYMGQKDLEKLNMVFHGTLKLSLIIGLFWGLINLLFARTILELLGAKKDVLQYALPYFIAVAVPSVFLSLQITLASVLRGFGDTKTAMKIASISNLINVVLDYIFIFGLFNFNGLGILGAGLATSIARLFSVLLLLKGIQKHKDFFQLSFKAFLKPQKEFIKKLLNISLPAAAEKLIMRSGQVIYGAMIISIGTKAYAAHNIAGTIESFSYLPGMGFGVAAATLVGQSLGEKNKAAAKQFAKDAYLLSAGFMVFLGLIFYIFAPYLARIFTKDPLVAKKVVDVLRIIAYFQPFLAITLVITSALQGAGDTKFPMITSLLGIWGIRVLGVYILCVKMNYGLTAVWSVYALDISVRGCILISRFLKGKWQEINLT